MGFYYRDSIDKNEVIFKYNFKKSKGGENMKRNEKKEISKKISYEKPEIDAKKLEKLSKAFAVKNGMSSC